MTRAHLARAQPADWQAERSEEDSGGSPGSGRAAMSTRPRMRHVAGLDGIRGLAVALVLLYHGGVPHVPGGHLGVTMFFTLSGFLITSLLLVEREQSGRISLRAFWGRRARRLVPALLMCFPLIAVVIAVSPTPAPHGVLADAVAGALWIANWRFVLTHHGYADLFSMPSPFQHFWSLAVEEQYYLVFPVVTAVVLARRGRRALALLLGQLVIVSTALTVVFTVHSATTTRAYYGTDTRVAEILVGALLALALTTSTGPRSVPVRVRWGLDAAAVISLAAIGFLAQALGTGDLRLYRGGLFAAAVATAVVIAAAVQPGSLVGRLLAIAPLRSLGVISYGVYLFHWPLFLAISTQTTGLAGAWLFVLRAGSTVALATASYVLLEVPVRRGWLPTRPALTAWAVGATAGVTAVGLAAGIIPMPSLGSPSPGSVAAAAAPAPVTGASRVHVRRGRAHTSTATRSGAVTPSSSAGAAMPSPTTAQRTPRAGSLPSQLLGDPHTDYAKAPPLPEVPRGALKILVVGDSIGNNLGSGLVQWAAGRSDVVVYNLAIPACSLSLGGQRRLDPDRNFPLASWCYWWNDPTSQRYHAMQQFAPDIVFVLDGINETFERKLDTWNSWQKPGNPQFDDFVVSQYESFISGYRNMGAKVVLANAPCGDWSRFFNMIPDGEQRVNNLNSLVYPRVVDASTADLYGEVCPNGQYSDTVDGVDNARPDGFHFTQEAAYALARDWLGPLLVKDAQSALAVPTG